MYKLKPLKIFKEKGYFIRFVYFKMIPKEEQSERSSSVTRSNEPCTEKSWTKAETEGTKRRVGEVVKKIYST